MTVYRLTQVEDIIRFITGGMAEFTLYNGTTGINRRYKVRRARRKENQTLAQLPYYVYYLKEYSNTEEYYWVAILEYDCGGFRLQYRQPGRNSSQAGRALVQYRIIEWFIGHLNDRSPFPDGFEFQHQGICCYCGNIISAAKDRGRGYDNCKQYRPPAQLGLLDTGVGYGTGQSENHNN